MHVSYLRTLTSGRRPQSGGYVLRKQAAISSNRLLKSPGSPDQVSENPILGRSRRTGKFRSIRCPMPDEREEKHPDAVFFQQPANAAPARGFGSGEPDLATEALA